MLCICSSLKSINPLTHSQKDFQTFTKQVNSSFSQAKYGGSLCFEFTLNKKITLEEGVL